MVTWRRVVVGCVLGVAVLVTGCGTKEVRGVKVQGKIVKDGQPLAPERGERQVTVVFERVEPADKQTIRSGGKVQKDGTFTIEGQMEKGTPPGKYEVRIQAEMSGDAESRFALLFADGKTPFVAEVSDAENQSFLIDVGKKTITKVQ